MTREDLFLIDYAYRNKVPLLGICLGMQAMASYQNRKPLAIVNRDNTHASREKIVHSVILEESHLSHILQDKKIISVNSRHFECALSSRRFQVVGRSPDGVMEAIENADHPFQIGVQWHPESMIYADENSKKIFESFLEVARSFPSSSQ